MSATTVLAYSNVWDEEAGRPYVWDVAGRAKWDAWNSHGAMKRADARRRYVALVAELSSSGSNDGGDAAEAQAAQSIAGARVSTMQCESEGGDEDISSRGPSSDRT